MSPTSRWEDLGPRIASGAVIAGVGIAAMAVGGAVFALLAALCGAVMVWELARMIAPLRHRTALGLGLLAFAIILAARWIGGFTALALLAVPAAAGAAMLVRDRLLFFGFALAVAVAAWGLTVFRDSYGVVWLFWLVLVVVATDISGYFAGRAIGGGKFWPRISPKKTWSGTVAGWLSAAVIGAIFLTFTDAGRDLIWISSVVAFASQMGDIAESAVKRHCGVKDSSHLIPGHGGLFDRFDGLLGASLVMLLAALVVDVPDVRF